MKQQGFHVSEDAQWAAKASGTHLSSSQASASSKLADGLQGLMEMCNAGSLTSTHPTTSVSLCLQCSTCGQTQSLPVEGHDMIDCELGCYYLACCLCARLVQMHCS